jgi:hypothetical protein
MIDLNDMYILPTGGARNCMYLLALKEMCQQALLHPYQAALGALLSVVK